MSITYIVLNMTHTPLNSLARPTTRKTTLIGVT